MNILKTVLSSFLLTIFILNPVTAKAEAGTGNKVKDLNSQIVQEIKDVLQNTYLKYQSKNLSGEITLNTAVKKSGKIMFTDIKGVNEDLLSNVYAKLNSLNLWTSPDYSTSSFRYIIKYRN